MCICCRFFFFSCNNFWNLQKHNKHFLLFWFCCKSFYFVGHYWRLIHPAFYRMVFPLKITKWFHKRILRHPFFVYDGCASYSTAPWVASLLHHATPKAKIIYLLREPVRSKFLYNITVLVSKWILCLSDISAHFMVEVWTKYDEIFDECSQITSNSWYWWSPNEQLSPTYVAKSMGIVTIKGCDWYVPQGREIGIFETKTFIKLLIGTVSVTFGIVKRIYEYWTITSNTMATPKVGITISEWAIISICAHGMLCS